MDASHLTFYLDLTRRRVDFDGEAMRWFAAWLTH